MSAVNDPATALALLGQSMDELMRRIREIDANDPRQGEYESELYALRELHAALQSEKNKLIALRMERLAREIASLEPGTPRRSEIVRLLLPFTKYPK
jgi:hypothetical protein